MSGIFCPTIGTGLQGVQAELDQASYERAKTASGQDHRLTKSDSNKGAAIIPIDAQPVGKNWLRKSRRAVRQRGLPTLLHWPDPQQAVGAAAPSVRVANRRVEARVSKAKQAYASAPSRSASLQKTGGSHAHVILTIERVSTKMLNQSGSTQGRGYGRHELNVLISIKGSRLIRFDGEMANISPGNNKEIKPEKSKLSEQDVRSLLIVCTELVNLCARLTGKIDPAATEMLTQVMDEIVSGNKSQLR